MGPGKDSSYGPFIQSQRLHIYHQFVQLLLQSGHAYKCYCSPQLLQLNFSSSSSNGYPGTCRHLSLAEQQRREGDPFVVRFKSPNTIESPTFYDVNFKHVNVHNDTLNDIILLKSDGWPTYHLASVIDDHLMGITHVLRGHEWLPSTYIHILLYKAFNWVPPNWVHLPLLLNKQRKKLSKRDSNDGLGSMVNTFRELGYHPNALLNFIALLGWTPPNNQEILSIKDMQEHFNINRLHLSPAVVDLVRLDWLQKTHFSASVTNDNEKLISELRTMLIKKYSEIPPTLLSDKYLDEVLTLISTRLYRIQEIVTKASYFWIDPDYSSPSNPQLVEQHISNLDRIHEITLNSWKQSWPTTAEQVHSSIMDISSQLGLPKCVIMLAIRHMVTGTRIGANLGDTILLLGRDTVERRINKFVISLSSSSSSTSLSKT